MPALTERKWKSSLLLVAMRQEPVAVRLATEIQHDGYIGCAYLARAHFPNPFTVMYLLVIAFFAS
jgi:hypothetical protein